MEFKELELAPLSPLSPLDEPAEDKCPSCAESFVPKQVCPKMIRYAVEGDKLAHVSFVGGCDGNLKAIAALVEGMEVEYVIDKLSGITCGKKTTSCVDQLCSALREHV